MRLPIVRSLRESLRRGAPGSESPSEGTETPHGAEGDTGHGTPGAAQGAGMVGPHWIRYTWAPGAQPAAVPVPGSDFPSGEVLDRISLFVGAAAPAPGEPGSPGTMSHTRLPGGGALLCRTEAGTATEPAAEQPDAPSPDRPDAAAAGGAVRCVTACYLPGGATDLRNRLPVEMWLSPLWEPESAHEWGGKDADGHPEWCDDPGLVEFAAEQGERVEPFLADVQRLFVSPAGPQIVVAERDPADVARWVALACASLPLSCAQLLTFVLHTDTPAAAPHQIVGIGPGADFDRDDETARRYLHRLHDGLGGPGSPPVSGADVWAEVAAQAWRRGIVPRTAQAGARAVHGPFDIGPLQNLLLPRGGAALPGVTRWADQPGNEDAFGEAGRILLGRSAGRDDDGDLPGSAMAALPASPLGAVGGTAGASARSVAYPADAVPRDGYDDGAVRPDRVRPYATGAQGRTAPDGPDEPLTPHALGNLLDWLGVRMPAGGERHLVRALAGLAPRLPAEPPADRGQDPRETVRAEAVARLATAIDGLQAEPPAEWGTLLELLHALSPPTDQLAGTSRAAAARTPQDTFDIKVAARLSRSLLQSEDRRDSPGTRALLDRLSPPFVRLVLEQVAKSDSVPQPRSLVALAASPLGDWLGLVEDQAPLRLRLVVEARRLALAGSSGLQVFRGLARLLAEEADWDPWMYELAWWLAWPGAGPTTAECVSVARGFPAGQLCQAGLDRELARPLTAPGPVTDQLGELAHALLTMSAQLSTQQRSLARALDLGWRLTTRAIGPTTATEQMDSLEGSGSIRQELLTWFNERLAARLAVAHPTELREPVVLERLRRARYEDLLQRYVEAQLEPANREELVSTLVADPEAAALLFLAWSEEDRWCSSEWARLAPLLTDKVFGDVVKRLRDPERRRVAGVLDEQTDPKWVGTWWEFIRRLPDPRAGQFGGGADQRDDEGPGAGRTGPRP